MGPHRKALCTSIQVALARQELRQSSTAAAGAVTGTTKGVHAAPACGLMHVALGEHPDVTWLARPNLSLQVQPRNGWPLSLEGASLRSRQECEQLYLARQMYVCHPVSGYDRDTGCNKPYPSEEPWGLLCDHACACVTAHFGERSLRTAQRQCWYLKGLWGAEGLESSTERTAQPLG